MSGTLTWKSALDQGRTAVLFTLSLTLVQSYYPSVNSSSVGVTELPLPGKFEFGESPSLKVVGIYGDYIIASGSILHRYHDYSSENSVVEYEYCCRGNSLTNNQGTLYASDSGFYSIRYSSCLYAMLNIEYASKRNLPYHLHFPSSQVVSECGCGPSTNHLPHPPHPPTSHTHTLTSPTAILLHGCASKRPSPCLLTRKHGRLSLITRWITSGYGDIVHYRSCDLGSCSCDPR